MPWYHDVEVLSRSVDRLLARRGLAGTHGLLQTFTDSEESGVTEDTLGWTIQIDLPGVKRQDVQVSVESSALTVRARREVPPSNGAKLVHHERRATQIHRSWRLPTSADLDAVRAELVDGVLTLSVAKRAEATRSRPIDIQTH